MTQAIKLHDISTSLTNVTSEHNINNAVGFLLYYKEEYEQQSLGGRFENALARLKNYFPWLQWQWFQIGRSRLLVWSHGEPSASIVRAFDGDIGLRIGSSPTICSRDRLQREMADDEYYHPQWNGKFVFVRLNQQGTNWSICNDWAGTIPVFRAEEQGLSVVSTSEPLTVAMMEFTEADMSQRGLVELLHHGQFLASHTLYKQMYFLEPDSRSIWRSGQFIRAQALDTVPASDERWDKSIDTLLDELKPLSEAFFREALAVSDSWIIPLSGGLDSRIIAVYAKAFGKEVRAFTYNTAYRNFVCGKAVAKALGLKWQQVDVRDDYLNRFTPLWLDCFGTSMHAHGMYHGPLLDTVKDIGLPMAVGFLGESLHGHFDNRKTNGDKKCLWIDYFRTCPNSKTMPLEDLEKILTFDPKPSIEAITEDLETRFNGLDCPDYQSYLRFSILVRQRHLVGFQSTMYDWWTGVSTPYFNIDFGRFVLSLPEEALEGRILQKRLLMHLSPQAAKIPGTFNDDGSPLISSLSYRLRHRLARSLPTKYKRGSLSVFRNMAFDREKDALLKHGRSALFPLNKAGTENVCSFIKNESLSLLISKAISEEKDNSSRWLSRIQPVVYRLLAG